MEDRDNLLDLLAAIETDENDLTETKQTTQKTITNVNEDEYFLSKIATNDLKVIQESCTSGIKNKQKLTSNNRETTKYKLNQSTIHNGDTDSSDDEDKRNFENRKYSDYGNEVRHLLNDSNTNSESFDNTNTWKTKRPVLTSRPNVVKPVEEKGVENILTDPFFGIRISKPLISSATLKDRMAGRAAVSMARIKSFVYSKPTDDWVVAGVLVEKSPVKTSQNGNNYIIFTVSDLKLELKSISLFLFKNAYKELWKTAIGTVIGVLNPSILENREGSKQEATLSVDNHQKVMIFGQSKDFGHCKSLRKDGKQCQSFVNTNNCQYCVYHVKQAYQQCSRRSELQAKYAGGGLTALRNKVLGKNEVFYAGKSYMAIPAKTSKKLVEKDSKILQALKKSGTVTLPRTLPKSEQKPKKAAAISFDTPRAQRLRDLQLLEKLNGSSNIGSALQNKIDPQPKNISSDFSLDESKNSTLTTSKIKSGKQNIEDKTGFDPKTISSGITLEESKNAALSVISKLKNNKVTKHNSLEEKSFQDKCEFDPTTISSGISVKESKKTAFDVISKLNSAEKSKYNSLEEDEKSQGKNEFDPKSISSGISLDESKKSALDVISKLKNNNKSKKNLFEETSLQGENESISSEISMDKSENTALDIISKFKDTKRNKGKVLKGISLEDEIEFNPKTISSEISLGESKKTALDVICKLKNGKNISLEETSNNKSELDRQTISSENLLDESKNSACEVTSKLENYKKIEECPKEDKGKFMSSENEVSINNTLPSNKSKLLLDKLKILNFVPKLSNPNYSKNEFDLELNFDGRVETESISSLRDNIQTQKPSSLGDNVRKQKKNIQQKSAPKNKSKNTNIEVALNINKSKLSENFQGTGTVTPLIAKGREMSLSKQVHKRVDAAKMNALNWVQKNGPISKNNSSGSKKSGVKRFLNETESSEPKKLKLNENVVLSERFKKIMGLTSKHADLLENYDQEQQEKYFNKLEAKEKMEEKMMSTFTVNCKAVKCLTCKYTNFSAADRCKQERHVLKVFNAVKRFFKCGDCGNRTVSLEIVPLFSCKNCNSSKWERTTMMKEKKVHVGEALSIRGGEQTFLNSHIADANVNLLVPEN